MKLYENCMKAYENYMKLYEIIWDEQRERERERERGFICSYYTYSGV